MKDTGSASEAGEIDDVDQRDGGGGPSPTYKGTLEEIVDPALAHGADADLVLRPSPSKKGGDAASDIRIGIPARTRPVSGYGIQSSAPPV